MPERTAFLLFLVHLFVPICAFSLGQNSAILGLDGRQSHLADFLKISDLDVVSVHRKPDCFRHAAAHIRTRCDTLEVDEPARVRAAISMTLCELKTAQHRSLPMECSPFDSGTDQNSAAGDDHSFCVEALSRSTQFWASYSGYLREIPQLCFAFQKGNDIDRARDLYQNTTSEMVILLGYMSGRAKEDLQNRLLWRNLVEETQKALVDLRLSPSVTNDQLSQVVLRTQDALEEIIRGFRDRIDESRRLTQDELDLTLSTHSRSLSTMVETTELAVASRLDLMYAQFMNRVQDMLPLTVAIQDNLAQVESRLSSLGEVVQRVAGSANYTSSSLDQSLKKANGLYKAHTDVSRRTAQLAQTITHLATTALEEMVHINHTAMAVRTGLRSSLEGRILGLLNFWDSRSAGYTSHWSFAGAWFFFRLMWWLSRTMLSSPLQMLVCFLAFFLRWTYRRLFSPASWKGYPQPVSGPPFIDSRITDSSFRPWTSGPTYSDFRYPGAPSARVHSTNFPWAKQARVWRIPHRSTNWD